MKMISATANLLWQLLDLGILKVSFCHVSPVDLSWNHEAETLVDSSQ